MIEGKTKSGFKFKIDSRVLDDWSLVEAIALSDSKDASEQICGLKRLYDIIIGPQNDALKKHIADRNDGFVPSEQVSEMLVEIITTARELKNSQSSEG